MPERPPLERINAACEFLAESCEVDRIEILRLDERLHSARVVGSWGAPDLDAPAALSLREDSDLGALADGPPGVRVLALAPIQQNGHLIGFLRVQHRDPNYRWLDSRNPFALPSSQMLSASSRSPPFPRSRKTTSKKPRGSSLSGLGFRGN